jgi:phytoene dehydrogenase-like protein
MAATQRANIIGAGPNGLAAAITLAQSGLEVAVFEAESVPGGAARTLDLTLPGFHHDFGSAVHPLAAGSPFFLSLPLEKYGLQWLHPSAPLAHPFDDGTAVTLERSLEVQAESLGRDGRAWRGIFSPLARYWPELAADILRPLSSIPRHPLLMANFGACALLPATTLARFAFRTARTRALFAGLAAHSFLALDTPLSAAFGLVLGAVGHAVGWPIPRGGAQAITDAMIAYLQSLGGIVHLGQAVSSLDDLPSAAVTLCDISPRQLLAIAGHRLSKYYRSKMNNFQYGPAVFKIDYALSEPIPWRSQDCRRAGTVHLGGSLEEIVESEASMVRGQHAKRPFVLLAQPTLIDPGRAPQGKHIAWSYCHVPHGSTGDMTAAIESQIERFAPGFRETILARSILSPARLESMDANLVGGDISGGAMNISQFFFRPTFRNYRTSTPNLYLCSSSTPPGGGVHGMCGYHAAMMALADIRK